jgi:hypothetical protein
VDESSIQVLIATVMFRTVARMLTGSMMTELEVCDGMSRLVSLADKGSGTNLIQVQPIGASKRI